MTKVHAYLEAINMKNCNKKIIIIFCVIFIIQIFSSAYLLFGLPWERKDVANIALKYLVGRTYKPYDISNIGFDFRTHSYIIFAVPAGLSPDFNKKTERIIWEGIQIIIVVN